MVNHWWPQAARSLMIEERSPAWVMSCPVLPAAAGLRRRQTTSKTLRALRRFASHQPILRDAVWISAASIVFGAPAAGPQISALRRFVRVSGTPCAATV